VIGHLRGDLLNKSPQEVIVDVAGVGYRVLVPLSTYYRLDEPGSKVALLIHTHVREDALLLFGFSTVSEQKLFEQLISVSGVGPKLALNILSGIEAPALSSALRSGDVATLTRIPGVGKKTAERLVLELKSKMPPAVETQEKPETGVDLREDLFSALGHLGYSHAEAERAIQRAMKDAGHASFEENLRRALQILSGR
jgi:Holliday junction DNA helicase RuvA